MQFELMLYSLNLLLQGPVTKLNYSFTVIETLIRLDGLAEETAVADCPRFTPQLVFPSRDHRASKWWTSNNLKQNNSLNFVLFGNVASISAHCMFDKANINQLLCVQYRCQAI